MKLVHSALLLSIGFYLAFWVRKRRFNRTNSYGVEEFGSYSEKAIARVLEKVVWAIALTCMAAGGLLVAL